MLSVVLTGNIASGKSTVLALFRRWGAAVTDADAVVRELQRPGTPVFDAIVRRFGAPVVAGDGTLDRAALRHIAFTDPAARADLEAIVHPAVAAARAGAEAAARAAGARVIVHDVPLLFETGRQHEFDRVVLMDAPLEVRRARLLARSGLDPGEADRILRAQRPSAVTRPHVDFVIENDGDLETLALRARAVWDRLEAEARERA